MFSKIFKFAILIAIFCDSCVSTELEEYLENSSIVYGFSIVSNDSRVNRLCSDQLQLFQQNVLQKQLWALKILDSSGSKPAGFVYGHNYWLGSREACEAAQTKLHITLSSKISRNMHSELLTTLAPYDVEYRVVYLAHQSKYQMDIKFLADDIIHLGLCVPKSCDDADIMQLSKNYVESAYFQENAIYDLHPTVIGTKNLKLSGNFYQRRSLKIVLVLLTLSIFFITKAARSSSNSRFLACFDLKQNAKDLFAIRANTANEIPIIRGMRSGYAVWESIYHMYLFMYFTVNNKVFVSAHAERLIYQFLSSTPMLLDMFFVISGFLQALNFLRNTKQMLLIQNNSLFGNIKLFVRGFLRRYMRIGFSCLIVMAMGDLLCAYLKDVSIYQLHFHYDATCSEHWMRNMLFIQNLYSAGDMCLLWSWYLACDMQFFLIGNVLLFAYARWPKFVKILAIGGILFNFLWIFQIGLAMNLQFTFDVFFTILWSSYTDPLVRILPFIMGGIAAWFFVEKEAIFKLSETTQKKLWYATIAIWLVTIHASVKRDIGPWITIAVTTLGRLNFSLSISWALIGSVTGSGCFLSRFLKAKVFQHLDRISFTIYLLHPLVIIFIFGLTNSSTHVEPLIMSIFSYGLIVVIYVTSIVFALIFEIPFNKCLQILFDNPKRKVIKNKTT